MYLRGVLPAICCFAALAQTETLVSQVQKAALAGDFAAADRELDLYRGAKGVTAEYIEALSWIGRGQLKADHLGAAEENAVLVRKLCDAQLLHRKLDAEGHLPTALGAAIEVEAQVLAQQNQRDQAVILLRDQLKRWQATSIRMRIQKNLNLLTLEGKPAPALDVAQWIGDTKPMPLSAHRGHPVLLFLWAHWCPDCKNEVAVVQKLIAIYGPRGLVVIAPTQRYGYVAEGKEAPPPVETQYIAEVFRTYYAPLGAVEIPLSERNFASFGVSTTPTMVLIDGNGIVRLYNPGAAAYDMLAGSVEKVLHPVRELQGFNLQRKK